MPSPALWHAWVWTCVNEGIMDAFVDGWVDGWVHVWNAVVEALEGVSARVHFCSQPRLCSLVTISHCAGHSSMEIAMLLLL